MRLPILLYFITFSGQYIPPHTGFLLCIGLLYTAVSGQTIDEVIQDPNIEYQALFPLQSQHVHGSTLVELPNGEILAAWFQGSGERQADDVAIMGARWSPGTHTWSHAFVMADYPDFPDINPVLFIGPHQRLWLVWYTVLANQWETSILTYRLSDDYLTAGPPQWKWQQAIYLKPGGSTQRGIQADDPFVQSLTRQMDAYLAYLDSIDAFAQIPQAQPADMRNRYLQRTAELLSQARGEDMMARGMATDSIGKQPMGYPRFRRMGWQTRNKPMILSSGRILLPLYADGFDFSIMAMSDDAGNTWQCSEPLFGIGNVQPTLIQREDQTIVAYMRDNGPPPQRLMMSTSIDEGKTWSQVVDADLPNPGSAADVVQLSDGSWLMVHNDTEDERYSLALTLSKDEGYTWHTVGHLAQSKPEMGRFHYPAIIEAHDGTIHVTYSYHIRKGEREEKTIYHAKIIPFW